jgi:hypothetical protein
MGFREEVVERANELADKTPEEIAREVDQEEIEKLERMKDLAKAAEEYLENSRSETRAPDQPCLQGGRGQWKP